MQASVRFYRYAIGLLALAILVAAWSVVGSLFSAPRDDATPRTAAERLIMDAAAAAKRAPDSVDARLNLVKALAASGNYGDALVQARFAEKLDSKNVQLAMLRGSIYAKMGNTEEALKWLKKAAAAKDELADFYAQVHTDMAQVYEDAGRLDQALKAYRKVLGYAPISASAYQNIGRIQEKKGSVEAALEAYRTAYRFDSQDRTVAESIERLNQALAARTAGQGGK